MSTLVVKPGQIKFEFEEPTIAAVDLGEVGMLAGTVIRKLCGETYQADLRSHEEALLKQLISEARGEGLTHAQFNEMLLLLNQDRVSRDFFEFFFGPRPRLEEIGSSIIRFRGFAMLKFGNFRYAYKDLIGRDDAGLRAALEPYSTPTKKLERDFMRERTPAALGIRPISRDKTWQLGYVAKRILQEDTESLRDQADRARELSEPEQRQLGELLDRYAEMAREREHLENQALENTDVYLTWDYMDVYVATSMRSRWEFMEAFDFIERLFSFPSLKPLNLRWFDPTQSLSRDRIDKGLVEGLMLKRARCTVYMAQEYDSMGKDSELAATLAQGKPVIAYVPSGTVEEFQDRIRSYPLDFIKRRFLIHLAEGLLEDERYEEQAQKIDPDFRTSIDGFIRALDDYREHQPLILWSERDEEFKSELGEIYEKVCQLSALAEQLHYDTRRADVLRKDHPLSVQVNLATGVANGVLVVRRVDDCAKLLKGILTNAMSFTIRSTGKTSEGVTVLEERISGCPFRVVTDNEKLTNSFWNFYLKEV